MTFPRGMYNPYTQTIYQVSLKQWLEDIDMHKQFCINGKWMDLETFVNHIYPTDCAERTHLILKLTERTNENKSKTGT